MTFCRQLANTAKSADEVHAAWLLERQDEDRRRSLIRRLEQLAEDAKIERLDTAAALLRAAAEDLRFALAHDRAGRAAPPKTSAYG